MNVLEKILEEIDESFDENTQDIEDSEGIHHFVINSSLALCIVKNIIRDYMNKIPDTKNVAKGIDIDSAIDLLKNMQNPKIDYADMVCAPSFCYGKRYVYPDPEDYAIEAAIVALNEKKERELNCDSERHNDWIPVEERLPEEKGDITKDFNLFKESLHLITDGVNVTIATFDGGYFRCCDDYVPYTDVTAWQPLPKPYKPKKVTAAGMEHIMSRFTKVE